MTTNCNTFFQSGSTVQYNGKDAKVVTNTPLSSDYIMLEIDGKQIVVKKEEVYSDMFGVNQKWKECTNFANKRIADLDADIEKREERIKENKKIFVQAIEDWHKYVKQISQLFSKNGVTNVNQLQGDDLAQYKVLCKSKNDAKMIQLRADNSIFTDVIEIGSDCSYKQNWINQRALAEHMMG